MTWWTTVPGLTPVAAWDAAATDSAGVLDRVGNNLLLWPNPVTTSFLQKAVKGKGSTAYLQSTIQLPAQYTLLIFLRPTLRSVMFSRSNTHASAVWLENDGQFNTRNDANVLTSVLGSAPNGTAKCVALVRGASAVSYFLNGTLLSNSIPLANCPDYLGRLMGWRDASEPDYALTPDSDFYAAGVWSGAATQADVQAIEAACRAELVGDPATFRGYSADVGRLVNTPPGLPASPIPISRGQVQGRRNIYQGGIGRITGTVKVQGTPNAPVHRKVILIDEATSLLVQSQWSDAVTGAYTFSNVDPNAKFTVVSYDHTTMYRAVIADNLTLANNGVEIMP